jgi:hypothetical protein
MLILVFSLIFISSTAAADLNNDTAADNYLDASDDIALGDDAKKDVDLETNETIGIYGSEDTELNVQVKDSEGNDVSEGSLTFVDVFGKDYTVEVKDGLATSRVSVKDTGKFNITCRYLGTSFYNSASTTLLLNVPIADEMSDVLASPEDDLVLSGAEGNGERNDELLDNSTRYGYWCWSIDMYNLNFTDLASKGVTDLILNYFAIERWGIDNVTNLIAKANEQGIHTHIWVQIFYKGSWVRPISREGVVNYEFFNEKIEEILGYVNITGVYGIHYDYIRFAGVPKYNNTAYQNPGGMEAITYFVNESAKAIRAVNPNIVISAALMPETDVLNTTYGDDYPELTKIFDVVIPMIYIPNFNEDTEWVKKTTQWFVENSNGAKVWTGLQAYTFADEDEEVWTAIPKSQMNLDIAASLSANATGVMLFRFGACNDIDFNDLSVNESEFDTFNYLNYIISTEKRPLQLKYDFTFKNGYDDNFANGILILRDDFVVDGANHVVDANGSARILNISGDNETFMNFRFVNANADLGGAIYVEGKDVTFINCTFENCKATNGGAVYTVGNNTKFINCTFINNTAASGGAILNGGTINVKDITFTNNTASDGTNDIAFAVDLVIGVGNNVYGKTASIIVALVSNGESVNGGTVSTIVNNVTYKGDVSNGIATIQIPNLNAGSYNVNISYAANDSKYLNNTVTYSFIINKQNLEITAKDATYIINYGEKYSITLKDIDGKVVAGEKVTFTLNGKNIGSATTNGDGVATITLTANILKTAKVGKKNLVITSTGSNYNTVTKTVKITINKEKTKLTAKSKTFKKSLKTKKYTVILKDSKNKAIKNVKVTLKVKGKTYTAKTNSKGKATFKIKKLTKKGTFKAKVKYAGNSYYNAVSKTVKIKNK